MSKAILYSGTKNASSWAMRAWLALRLAEVEFEEVVVDIRRPQRFANLERIGQISPAASVPVLDTGRAVIYDSSAIMEFANDSCGGRLLPVDLEQRARARALAAWQHSGLSSICRRISFESAFYPIRRPLSAGEKAEAARLFGHYEVLLARADGPYLFGQLSLADVMHVPTVVRLRAHDVDLSHTPLAAAWSHSIAVHPLVREWMSEAERLPHIWFDDYLVEGTWSGAEKS